jgi:hypothetical protein
VISDLCFFCVFSRLFFVSMCFAVKKLAPRECPFSPRRSSPQSSFLARKAPAADAALGGGTQCWRLWRAVFKKSR